MSSSRRPPEQSAWTHAGGDIAGALARLADGRRPAAWVWIKLECPAGEGEAELFFAWNRALELFRTVHAGRRAAWRVAHLVVEGERSDLERVALDLLAALTADSRRVWRVVLVEILPEDPAASLRCDPGYGLANLEGGVAVWVRPVAELDWRTGLYPTVSVIESRH